jgi:hypothetical protein
MEEMMKEKGIIKASLPPHNDTARSSIGFQQAFNIASEHPKQIYLITGNDTPFTVIASHSARGKHPNQPVLRFMSRGKEKARSYECCWGHITNCNRTHIDCYTKAMKP